MQRTVAYTIKIREAHIDTLGHVNNATYLALFEEARWELITAGGYDMAMVQKSKKGPVILDVHLQFQKELRLREEITIVTKLLDYPGKIGKLEQQMLNASGEVAATAVFTFGLFDLETRKLILPTPEWLKAVTGG